MHLIVTHLYKEYNAFLHTDKGACSVHVIGLQIIYNLG